MKPSTNTVRSAEKLAVTRRNMSRQTKRKIDQQVFAYSEVRWFRGPWGPGTDAGFSFDTDGNRQHHLQGTGGPSSAASIPAQGGTTFILLALSLGFLAYRFVRMGHGRGNSASLLVGALAIGSLISVTSGFSLLRDAYTVPEISIINDRAG